MPSPAMSVSSIVQLQYSAFAGQSPAFIHRTLPSLQVSSFSSSSVPRNALELNAQTRYRGDEKERLREQYLTAEMSPSGSSLGIPGMLYKIRLVLIAQERYRAADNVARRRFNSYEGQRGDSDRDTNTLKAMDLLGQVPDLQGSYSKAEKLFRRALQGRKNMSGSEHPMTLASTRNLALTYMTQGQLKDAEEFGV